MPHSSARLLHPAPCLDGDDGDDDCDDDNSADSDDGDDGGGGDDDSEVVDVVVDDDDDDAGVVAFGVGDQLFDFRSRIADRAAVLKREEALVYKKSACMPSCNCRFAVRCDAVHAVQCDAIPCGGMRYAKIQYRRGCASVRVAG